MGNEGPGTMSDNGPRFACLYAENILVIEGTSSKHEDIYKSRSIQSMEIDHRKTNRSIDINQYNWLIGIDWYRPIDDQSITTQETFIDWHRLEQDLEKDVMHTTCPIIRHF